MGPDATTNGKGTIRRFRVYRLYPIPVDGRDKPMNDWGSNSMHLVQGRGNVAFPFFFFFFFEGRYRIIFVKEIKVISKIISGWRNFGNRDEKLMVVAINLEFIRCGGYRTL